LPKLAAVICLFAYFLGGANVLPGLVGLTARIDQAHQVVISFDENGTQVILHHASAETGRQPTNWHQHGILSSALCRLWADSRPGPDHVLGFRLCSVSEKTSVKETSPIASQNFSAFIYSLGEDDTLSQAPISFSHSHSPLPGGDARVLCLRSTLLLI
jgi:hypothetical protein